MEVEGITIVIGEVDKYISAIQQAESAQALVKQFIDYLVKCQRKLARGGKEGESQALSQELNYAARKLVLKIQNEGPNPQLILALSEIITFFSVLTIPWLLGLVKTLTEGGGGGGGGGGRSKSSEGEDTSAQQTAVVLIIVATAKSGKISDLVHSKDKTSFRQITAIAKQLTAIAQGRVLEDIAFEGLFQLLDQLNEDTQLFTEYVLPAIAPLFNAKHWSLNTVVFALQASEHFKGLDLSSSSSILKRKEVAAPAHLDLFSNMFAHNIPNLDHQFWTLILKSIQHLPADEKKEFVAGIWKTVSGLLAPKKKDSKLLALFNWFWEIDEVVRPALLIESLFVVLRRQFHATKKDEEFPSGLEKLKEVTLHDKSLGAIVLRGFPELSSSLPENAVSDIAAQLASEFYERPQYSLRIAQSLAQMALDSTNPTFILEVTKFLFFYGFFISKQQPTSDKKKSKATPLPKVLGVQLRVGSETEDIAAPGTLNGAVRTQVQQIFFRVLVHSTVTVTSAKLVKKKEQDTNTKGLAQYDASTLLSAVVHFHKQLLAFSEQVELRKPLETSSVQGLETAMAVIDTIQLQLRAKPTDDPQRKELDAFLLLLCLSYVIQLHDPLETADNLTDLQHCYQDIFMAPAPSKTTTAIKKRKLAQDDAKTNKNKAIAVLVDVVISLQAKPLYLVGTLPEYIIRSFSKELTVEAIEGVLKAITEYSLFKTEADEDGGDDDDDDEVVLDEEEEGKRDGEGEENSNTDEDEDENEAATNEHGESSESDIMIDDLDDEALFELDNIIKTIMKKERKPKLKPPVSSKDPDIEFRERVVSLLFSYAKKANTVTLLELLPALLEAIGKIQKQKELSAKGAEGGEKNDTQRTSSETQGRIRSNRFYKSVTARLADIIESICHTRSALAQQLTPSQKDTLVSKLMLFCDPEQGVQISKLAVDALFLVHRSTEQLTKLVKADAKTLTPVTKYILHILVTRYPTQVWSDTAFFSLLMDRHLQQIHLLVSSLDLEHLKKVGKELETLLTTQLNEINNSNNIEKNKANNTSNNNKTKRSTPQTFKRFVSVLTTLRAVVQKMVSLSNRETVKEHFPELVFTLNKLIQNAALPASVHKLAKQITTSGFVGSQKQQKKIAKAKLKQEKKERENKKAEEEKDDDEEGEGDEEPKLKKGELYYTKSKAYQNSRKRKGKEGGEGGHENKPKKKKDSKWFANGASGNVAKRRKV